MSKRSDSQTAHIRFPFARLISVTLATLFVVLPQNLKVAFALFPPGGPPIGTGTGVSPQAGAPFPWEAGLQVSTYSSVNLFNGNLLTRITLTSWTGIGPDIDLALYHSSGAVEPTIYVPPGAGYNLGPGWSLSYSGQIIDQSSQNKAYVVEDDGLVKLYTRANSSSPWVPPDGVHDELTYDSGSQTWTLTRKNQWQRKFNSDGLLLEERDANQVDFGSELGVGLRVTIDRYEDDSLKEIRDAAGRQIFFKYHEGEVEGDDWIHIYTNQEGWRLELAANGRLETVKVMVEDNAEIDFTYLTDGYLDTVSDKASRTYTYDYDTNNRLSLVTDPETLTQELLYTGSTSGVFTLYTDRRGKDWLFTFYEWGGLVEIENPLGKIRQFDYDSDRNRTDFTDELSNTWTAGYDTTGNMEWFTDPLGHTWSFTYDSLNNLTSLTPPLNDEGDPDTDKTVELLYEDEYEDPNEVMQLADPTHVTSIIEPADGEGNGEAVTLLTYHHEGDGRGDLATVTDEIGVQTRFIYTLEENALFPALTRVEGPLQADPNDPPTYPVSETFTFDNRGQMTQASGYNGAGHFDYTFGEGCSGRTSMETATDMTCEAYDVNPAAMPEDPPNNHLPIGPDPLVYIPLPHCGVLATDCGDACLDAMDNVNEFYWPTQGVKTVSGTPPNHTFSYDQSERFHQLGRNDLYQLLSMSVRSSRPGNANTEAEFGPGFTRAFTLVPDANGNLTTLTDADAIDTDYVYDDANRLKEVWNDGLLVVEYTLDDAGRPTFAEYANGTSTGWNYDDAGRLDWIEHKRGSTRLLKLDYTWTPDGLVSGIEQTDAGSNTYGVTFEYDRRGRLIHEYGTIPVCPNNECGSGYQSVAVDLAYTYDQLGNRLTKTDATTTPDTVTTYAYDVHDPNWPTTQGTYNHRLLGYAVTQTDPNDPNNPDVLEQTWYGYNRGGQTKTILTQYPTSPPSGKDSDTYYATVMNYNIDQHLWLLRKAEIDVETPTNITKTLAREFRYDGDSRVRYYERNRNPNTLAPNNTSERWHEYVGSSIYADLTVDPDPNDPNHTLIATTARRYVHASDGKLIGWYDTDIEEWHFVHADMLGTTRLVTDGDGYIGTGQSTTGGSAIAYSAFGEILAQTHPGDFASRSRYGYCGGWGYQNDGLEDPDREIGMLHVGARYLDPSLGRFTQRDPIAVYGSRNMYGYVNNQPTQSVDPTGLAPLSVQCQNLGLGGIIVAGVAGIVGLVLMGLGGPMAIAFGLVTLIAAQQLFLVAFAVYIFGVAFQSLGL
jgi:RHS repeat-associated protein